MARKGATVAPEIDLEGIRSVKELPILAIDDDASILRFFERTLPKWGFANVFSAARPEEGLRMLAEYAFALALVDYQMPGMNGHEFREQARTLSPDTLHVLITAHGDVHGEGKLAEDTMESDFYGYIDKPFQPNTLRAQIRGGLNSVQRTVRAHGGRVRLQNRPGEGVTVDIELPVEADRHAATVDTHRG